MVASQQPRQDGGGEEVERGVGLRAPAVDSPSLVSRRSVESRPSAIGTLYDQLRSAPNRGRLALDLLAKAGLVGKPYSGTLAVADEETDGSDDNAVSDETPNAASLPEEP